MTSQAIDLREADRPVLVVLPHAVAVGLNAARIASVAPTETGGVYAVSGVRKVGAVFIAGHLVRVRPKTPVRRLFAMLGYSRDGGAVWSTDDVEFEEHADLVSALAHAFVRQANRAIAGGPLRGYVEREEALPMVRGRWRIGEQLTRRGGQPLPVEVAYDDYVADIAENRIVRSAAERLLRLPGLPADAVVALRRIVLVLEGVQSIPVGARVPTVRLDRRNLRYAPALALGALVLQNASVEHDAGDVVGSGFLVDMWAVFEDFVSVVLGDAFRPFGGTLTAQFRATLDHDHSVQIRPDLTWVRDGEVRACLDVKYKVEKSGQYPNADVYQMAAYCSRFGLDEGHLVYAAGGAEARRIELVNGPTVHQHALDLDHPLADVVRQLTEIAGRMS